MRERERGGEGGCERNVTQRARFCLLRVRYHFLSVQIPFRVLGYFKYRGQIIKTGHEKIKFFADIGLGNASVLVNTKEIS